MAFQLEHVPRYERTPLDREFFEERLRPRLPAAIFDVHVHINLAEHVTRVTPERLRTDWAMQVASITFRAIFGRRNA